MQHRDQLALASDSLTLLDAPVRVLLDGARSPHVDLTGERRNLCVTLLDGLAQAG